MTVPLGRPVVCPILVGRDAHLDALDRVLIEVRSGRGQTVLITGEAGIGKTRLVGEIQERASRRGFTSLAGHCFEPDRALPYAPVLDLLRARLAERTPDEIGQELKAAAPELVRLLPELSALRPGLAPTPAPDPEHEKRRLLHALASWISDLAAPQPLLVVLEDLHWSDETSLDFVLLLARRISRQSILLLCTYRSDETHPSLTHCLAELDRGRLATELVLSRLDRAEVGLMLRAIGELRWPVVGGLVDAVYTLTDGNPFFVEEVMRSLIATQGQWDEKPIGELPIPRTVQDAVQRRMVQLRPAARGALRLAAVTGQRFNFPILQALTGHDEGELLEIIRELRAAHLVVEESAEHFAFRHALTRQAVYAQLLARERRALHRSIAETMERVHADAIDRHRADLAYHFFEAGVWEKAFVHACRAGEQAQALYTPRAAVEHFTRALSAAALQRVAPPAQLYRARAQAYKTLGEFELARTDYEAALTRARVHGDRRAEWQILLDLGLLWSARDYTQTGEFYRRALELARALDSPAVLGHSLNRLGNWYVNVDQPIEGRSYHEEALAIFEALADRRGTAATLDLLGMAQCCCGDLSHSMATYARAIELLREMDDRSTLVLSLALLGTAAGNAHFDPLAQDPAKFAPAVAAAEEARAIARAIEWPAGEAFACAQLGQCLGPRGEYRSALAAAQEACRIAAEIDHRQWMAFSKHVLGQLYLDLLALPAAQRHLEQAVSLAREIGSRIWLRAASGALVVTCVQQGDLERAEAVLVAVPSVAGAPQSIWQRILARAHVELLLARREPVHALRLADELIASLEPIGEGWRGVGPLHLGRVRAEALGALGQVAQAEAILQAELEAARERGCLSLLWRLHLALSRLYRVGGRRPESGRELVAARMVVEELADRVPDEPVAELDGRSLREHFLQSATALLAEPYPPQPAHSPTRPPAGLTPREIEVLRLLAAGRSNRGIAAELFISVRTVEHHIASIYAKIGARRRAHAITFALHHDLLPPDAPQQ